MTRIKAKIRNAALATPALVSILGTNAAGDPFRWYDGTLNQGSKFPAVAVLVVDNAETYTLTSRLGLGANRVQFTVWGKTSADADSLAELIVCFLDTLNIIGVPNLKQYPNTVLQRRERIFTDTDPIMFQQIIDTQIFDNSLV